VKAGAVVDECSVIGDYCIVEPGAKVSGSTLWNGVYVGESADINGAIVSRNSSVGRQSRLEEGVIVGDQSQLQPQSSLGSNVKVWPQKTVEAGVRLTRSFITGSKWSSSLFVGGTVLGSPNIEITPEFVTGLAGAFASVLPLGANVLVGRDSHPVCRMVKHAVMTGLLSAGVNVIDVHGSPQPISRYMTQTSHADAGIHIHMCACMPRLISIDFCDGTGIPISLALRRRIEDLFGRNDHRRAAPSEIGQILVMEDSAENYARGLRETVNTSLLRDRYTRIVLDCAFGTISSVAPTLLGEIGCQAVTINSFPNPMTEPRTVDEKMQLLEDLSNMVPNLGAELGALLAEDASALHLVDDKGRILSEPVVLMAATQLILQTESNVTITVPSTAPAEMETLARQYGGRIVRTPNNERDLVVASLRERSNLGGDGSGRYVIPSLHNSFDGVAALVDILQRLSKTQRKLSEVVDSLPPLNLDHVLVPCGWDQKSEIIERLREEADGAESGDGFRLPSSGGWVYIVPDSTMPAFHVHAQAATPERLKALVDESVSYLKSACERV
jgi:mannose-1-phosphate guanylyltransferase/phosphomannomutase